MTYSVLKVPLNPNQPTNRAAVIIQCIVLMCSLYLSGSFRCLPQSIFCWWRNCTHDNTG